MRHIKQDSLLVRLPYVLNIISFFFFKKKTFFSSAILEWDKVDPSLRNLPSYNFFKISILKFIRPSPNKIFQCYKPKRIKLVTQLGLGLSHL